MKKKIKQSYFFLGTYYCHYQMTIFTTIRHNNLPVICTKNHYDTLKYCQTYYEKTSYLSCVNSKQEPSAPIYSFRSSKNDQDMALYITCFWLVPQILTYFQKSNVRWLIFWLKKKEPNLTESSDNCDRPTSVFLIFQS